MAKKNWSYVCNLLRSEKKKKYIDFPLSNMSRATLAS